MSIKVVMAKVVLGGEPERQVIATKYGDKAEEQCMKYIKDFSLLYDSDYAVYVEVIKLIEADAPLEVKHG